MVVQVAARPSSFRNDSSNSQGAREEITIFSHESWTPFKMES